MFWECLTAICLLSHKRMEKSNLHTAWKPCGQVSMNLLLILSLIEYHPGNTIGHLPIHFLSRKLQIAAFMFITLEISKKSISIGISTTCGSSEDSTVMIILCLISFSQLSKVGLCLCLVLFIPLYLVLWGFGSTRNTQICSGPLIISIWALVVWKTVEVMETAWMSNASVILGIRVQTATWPRHWR